MSDPAVKENDQQESDDKGQKETPQEEQTEETAIAEIPETEPVTESSKEANETVETKEDAEEKDPKPSKDEETGPKHPNFDVGDTIALHVRVIEGEKERIQVYEGVLIAQRRGGNRASIRVRKISFGEGVERVFPLCSPRIEKIEVVQTGRVRRAKLYYLRELRGKKARIKERQDFSYIKS